MMAPIPGRRQATHHWPTQTLFDPLRDRSVALPVAAAPLWRGRRVSAAMRSWER